MSLKDLNLKPVYYSDEMSLINEFYIPVLSKSLSYDRIAGYFCSNILAIAARGVSELIKNGGKLRLIANVVISEEDQEIIKKSIAEKENEILNVIENMEDELKKDHVKMLGWMIKNNILEIKIAVVSKGIEHQKVGILKDTEGNIISFSGSENETVGGWINNDEQFHVFCSWKEGDKEHLTPDVERFEKLWDDKGKRVRVYPVSEAFREGLIRTAPRDDSEFKKISKEILIRISELEREKVEPLNNTKKPEITLRSYQEDAIKKWIDNDYRGIFEMATGTGKTFTALGCVKELNKEVKNMIVVISCPYNHLIQQWAENIDQFGINFKVLIADSSNGNWRNELMDKIYDIKNKILNNFIILTTHNTFSTHDFIDRMKKIDYDIFLICDEVHGIGSEERKNGLIEDLYKYRLGLSATPDRWFDKEGTKLIRDFFKETVYEFSLKKAISEKYLVKYEYRPLFVTLNERELKQYENETKRIAKSFFASKGDDEKNSLFNLLCIKRQKIIVNSEGKYEILKKILNEIKPVKHCLIYVSPEQLEKVKSIVSDLDIRGHKFTCKEGVKPEDRFDGLSERDFLIKEFELVNYEVLIAIKCLDEGVDIKPARIAIILASTTNPREYIQRRGRILRRDPTKDKAIIYDFIVLPPLNEITTKELYNLELKILDKEMIRYKEFADAAENKLECMKIIIDFEKTIIK